MTSRRVETEIRPQAVVRVHFREIDALHDLRCTVGRVKDDLVISRNWVSLGKGKERVDLIIRPLGTETWFNTNGDSFGFELFKGCPLPDGAYRGYKYSGDPYCVLQTFVREDAKPVAGKWLYVFESSNPEGSDAELVREVSVQEDGAFRSADLKAASAGGARRLGKPGDPWIDLPRESLTQGGLRERHYFAYVTRVRLTWPRVLALGKEIAARGSALGDPFFADCLSPDGKWVPSSFSEGKPSALMLYVLDACAEAERRASVCDETIQARDEWEADPGSEATDYYRSEVRNQVATRPYGNGTREQCKGTYTLAKELEAFVTGAADLESIVNPALNDFVEWVEWRLRHLLWAVHVTSTDLACWIGKMQEVVALVGTIKNGKVYRTTGFVKRGAAVRWIDVRLTPGYSHPTCPFAAHVADFEDAPDDQRYALSISVAAMQLPLRETEEGRAWLESNFGAVLLEQKRAADGGTSMVLESIKHFAKLGYVNKQPHTALNILAGTYNDFFATRFREKALSSFEDWCCALYGVANKGELEKKVRTEEYFEFGKAKRMVANGTPVEELKIKPAWLTKVERVQRWAKAWELGTKLITLSDQVLRLTRDEKLRGDPWAWADAAAKAGDTADAALKLADGTYKLADKGWKIMYAVKYGGVGPLKLATTIAFLAIKGHKLQGEYDRGEREGMMIGMMGSVMVGIGEVVAGTAALPLAIAVGLGLAFQYAGERYADHYNASKRFLRWTRFGKTSWLDERDDVIDEPWFREPDPQNAGQTKRSRARDLKWDVPLARRTLMQLKFDFEVTFFSTRVLVRPRNMRCLTPGTKWTIELYRQNQDGTWQTDVLATTLVANEKDERWLCAHVDSRFRANQMHAPGKGFVAKPWLVKTTMDAFGDGKFIAVRWAECQIDPATVTRRPLEVY